MNCYMLLLCFSALVCGKVHFNGDKVFRITPKTKDEVEFIHEFIKNMGDKLDVWKEPSHVGNDIDIHVHANDVDQVKDMLNNKGIKYTITIDDLEKLVNEESLENEKFGYAGYFDYNRYNRYNDIVGELYNMARQYTNAETFVAGSTYERRSLVGIKISKPNSVGRKTAVWVDGGIHAREWISPATVMFLMKQLLKPDPKYQSKVNQALNKYDFYILPVFNADGYEYTHTGNRMWRKTRSRGRYCRGADPNRNWDSKFGGAGTSSSECTDIYHGSRAFSEIETRTVSSYLASLSKSVGLKSYWNVHAYSQLLLYPWSYTTARPRDINEIDRVAVAFKNGVYRESYKRFTVGQPSRILYAVAGGSIDWTYEKLGVKYSYAPELRPGQGEMRNGFLLPPNQIAASGREFTNGFLDAVLAML